jgi:hypothetical protein
MKCLESIPNFGSRVEMVTFLRTIADDIETGKAALIINDFKISYDMGGRILGLDLDVMEER